MYMSFFFFKPKTAYEVRISDWSSDVCSPDLPDIRPRRASAWLGVTPPELLRLLRTHAMPCLTALFRPFSACGDRLPLPQAATTMPCTPAAIEASDRKSTRLNSSH